MKKKQWIEDILQTAKHIKPVASNPFMAACIEAKLHEVSPVNKLSLRWVYASAAAMLLLLAMNITVWRSSIQSSKTAGVQQLMQEYGWANNDLYSINLPNPSHE